MRNTKKPRKNVTGSIIERLDDIRQETSLLRASFEAHLKQDEQFYLEVRDIVKSQNSIADRLGEYNTQLQIHIAGVNELKEQTRIMRDEREIVRKEYEARFKLLEARALKEEGHKEANASFKDRVKFAMSLVGTAVTVIGALAAAAKWLIPLVLM